MIQKKNEELKKRQPPQKTPMAAGIHTIRAMLLKEVEDWTNQDVVRFLQEHNLSACCSEIQIRDFTGRTLLEATPYTLRRDLGMATSRLLEPLLTALKSTPEQFVTPNPRHGQMTSRMQSPMLPPPPRRERMQEPEPDEEEEVEYMNNDPPQGMDLAVGDGYDYELHHLHSRSAAEDDDDACSWDSRDFEDEEQHGAREAELVDYGNNDPENRDSNPGVYMQMNPVAPHGQPDILTGPLILEGSRQRGPIPLPPDSPVLVELPDDGDGDYIDFGGSNQNQPTMPPTPPQRNPPMWSPTGPQAPTTNAPRVNVTPKTLNLVKEPQLPPRPQTKKSNLYQIHTPLRQPAVSSPQSVPNSLKGSWSSISGGDEPEEGYAYEQPKPGYPSPVATRKFSAPSQPSRNAMSPSSELAQSLSNVLKTGGGRKISPPLSTPGFPPGFPGRSAMDQEKSHPSPRLAPPITGSPVTLRSLRTQPHDQRPLPDLPGAPIPPSKKPIKGVPDLPVKYRDQQQQVNFKNEPWFFEINRTRGNELLRSCGTSGCFMVRISSAENPFTLSVLHMGKVYNIPIRKREDEVYALGSRKDNEQTFSSIEAMVSFHSKEPLVLYSAGGGHSSPSGSTVLKMSPPPLRN